MSLLYRIMAFSISKTLITITRHISAEKHMDFIAYKAPGRVPSQACALEVLEHD